MLSFFLFRYLFGRSGITSDLMKDIIDAIQPLLALNVLPKDPTDDCLITRDDQLYLYEVIGVLIISGESENQVCTIYECVYI